ncbi:MAG: helix-turn-helix domain-containing protein [Desulfotomaculales bacterium]
MTEKEIASLPAFLTVEETAKLLRLKRSTAYEYINQGIIPSARFGRFIRVPKAKLLEKAGLLKEQTAGAANI